MSEPTAPYMPRRIIVGIDPGQYTGVAVYDADDRRFLSLDTLTFWGAVALLEDLSERYMGLRVRLEDPNMIRAIYSRHDRTTGVKRDRVGQNVGMNKRDAQLWAEWLTDRGIAFDRVKPFPKSEKKNATTFKRTTGWQGRTNEHQRDAGMLVWGR